MISVCEGEDMSNDDWLTEGDKFLFRSCSDQQKQTDRALTDRQTGP